MRRAAGWIHSKILTATWLILFDAPGAQAPTGGGYPPETPYPQVWRWVGLGTVLLAGRSRSWWLPAPHRQGAAGRLPGAAIAGAGTAAASASFRPWAGLRGLLLGHGRQAAAPAVAYRTDAVLARLQGAPRGMARWRQVPAVLERGMSAHGRVDETLAGAACWTVDLPEEDELLLLAAL